MKIVVVMFSLVLLACGGTPSGGQPPGPDVDGGMPDPQGSCERDEDCNDGVECTQEQCDLSSKTCVYTPDHSVCQNDDVCDGQEICSQLAGCTAGIPPLVPPAAECVTPQIAAGGFHTCALLQSGGVRCWGYAAKGQLGYGNTDTVGDDEFPKSVGDIAVEEGLVIQVVAGDNHTCVLFADGNVQCWGLGGEGALGYGNAINVGDDELPGALAEVKHVDVGGKVIQLDAQVGHTCALLSDGKVLCWGRNGEGQLGYPNTGNVGVSQKPAEVGNVNIDGSEPEQPGMVVQVATGGSHTCALLDNGKVRCWGQAGRGQLGYGHVQTIGDNEPPVAAGDIDLGGQAIQIAAGGSHTCALMDTGKVRCWGEGESGRLGYGNSRDVGDDETPAGMGDVDVGGPVVQLAAGGNHTCALLNNGKVRCWGSNAHGQLGYGHTTNIGSITAPSLAGDIDLGGVAVQITAGNYHTCARLEDQKIRCWGKGSSGRLGYGVGETIGDNESPALAGDVPVE